MLRTRAPLVSTLAGLLPFDLHVLGLPLALILSQDQTLHCKVDYLYLALDYVISFPESQNDSKERACYFLPNLQRT